MTNETSVCAIMITANRSEMVLHAVRCFRRQTYQNKRLLIWDSGYGEPFETKFCPEDNEYCVAVSDAPRTIGELRNEANSFWTEYPILIHWDSDDYSHPNRIAEQVALLQESGADAVGYREMLFWREPLQLSNADVYGPEADDGPCDVLPGEAWLYSNRDPRYALGTSLCYWRKTWEAKPFEAINQGEDARWISGLNCVGVSGRPIDDPLVNDFCAPRMVARIHAGNTSNAYRPEVMAVVEKQGGEWKRFPEWDKYCDGIFRSA